MNWKRMAYLIYPFLIGFLLPIIFFVTSGHDYEAKAGIIRHAELSSERPLKVNLAIGRTTVISFATHPEKVVPGNPQAIEINFLNHDLTIRPLASRPGNLIVYTKNNRYVILLQVVSETSYDDAVSVNTFSSNNRSLRLTHDTFVIEQVKLHNLVRKTKTSITAMISHQERYLQSDSLPPDLKCKGCFLRKHPIGSELVCSNPISILECQMNGSQYTLKRNSGREPNDAR